MDMSNMLVSHTSNVLGLIENKIRQKLRLDGRLTYAVMDFDFSYMIPANANRNEFRLPYNEAWGNFNWTKDGMAGEFDYNPFVLDVGTLGAILCLDYQVSCCPRYLLIVSSAVNIGPSFCAWLLFSK